MAEDTRFFLTLDAYSFLPVIEKYAQDKPQLLAAVTATKTALATKDKEALKKATEDVLDRLDKIEAECQLSELTGKAFDSSVY